MALFLFLGPKPRGLNFAEIHARGGRGLQRPTFRDLIPPWGHSPFGPGRGGTASFRGGRSPVHRVDVPGRRRGARRAWAAVAGGTRGAGPVARVGRRAGTRWALRAGGGADALGAETGPCGRAARGLGGCPGWGGAAACGPNAAKSGRGPGARSGGPAGGCTGRRRGARSRDGGPGVRRHSKLSPAACVGSGERPGGAGSAARRKSSFRYIRKRAGRRAFLYQIRAVLSR